VDGAAAGALLLNMVQGKLEASAAEEECVGASLLKMLQGGSAGDEDAESKRDEWKGGNTGGWEDWGKSWKRRDNAGSAGGRDGGYAGGWPQAQSHHQHWPSPAETSAQHRRPAGADHAGGGWAAPGARWKDQASTASAAAGLRLQTRAAIRQAAAEARRSTVSAQ